MMAYHLKFEMSGLPESTNRTRRDGHWAATYRKREGWKEMVYYAILEHRQRPPQAPLTKAQLKLTRCSSVQPDFEGLVSTFKAILDGLVKCGVLVDDNMNVIGQPDYRWEKTKPGRGKIRIEVQEMVGEQTQ